MRKEDHSVKNYLKKIKKLKQTKCHRSFYKITIKFKSFDKKWVTGTAADYTHQMCVSKITCYEEKIIRTLHQGHFFISLLRVTLLQVHTE